MLVKWLQHIEFNQPYFLWLLTFIPFLVVYYIKNRRNIKAGLMVTTTKTIETEKSFKNHLVHIPFLLKMLALFCFMIALARPQYPHQEKMVSGTAMDIMLCIDISGSMTEKDFLPNRLEAAKKVAIDFVKARTGDRIGLVIFSSNSFTLCPLTTYHEALLTQIAALQTGYLIDDGTAIGSGIATSVQRLRNSDAKSKIIILITDGVDFGGFVDAETAAGLAKMYDIKIYTIGIGSTKETEKLIREEGGNTIKKRKFEYNEKLLKSVSEATNGIYFNAKNELVLKSVYAEINKLERSEISIKTFKTYTEAYKSWMIGGFVFLFISMLGTYTLFKTFP